MGLSFGLLTIVVGLAVVALIVAMVIALVSSNKRGPK
jgi:hypothetical protein